MFIGHFGLGFAAKKATHKPSLATTFLAAQFIDLLWPFFLLLGIEKVAIDPGNTAFTPLNFVSYPYTHSLLAVTLWALPYTLQPPKQRTTGEHTPSLVLCSSSLPSIS